MTLLLEAGASPNPSVVEVALGVGQKVKVALEDASIAINAKPATVIAIAGESGSGKTTLSRLILGLITPSKGEIYYRGKPLSQMNQDEQMTFGVRCRLSFRIPLKRTTPSIWSIMP